MTRALAAPRRAVAGDVARCGQTIKSIRIVGGFLDGAALDFARGLNCIIGARGTGKTTVLELVRYALDTLPPGEEGKRIEALVEQNLAGGRVEVAVESAEGLTYVVNRAWGEAPIVLSEDGKATPITLSGGALFRADIYSQNEVESIADRPALQLALLDTFEMERIGALNSNIAQLQRDLAGSGAAIQPLQAKIAALNEELSALPAVNEQLKRFAAAGGSSAEVINQAHAQKSLRDREKRAIEGLGQFLGEYSARLETWEGQVSGKVAALFCRDIGSGPNEQLLGQARQGLLACASDIDVALVAVRRRIRQTLEGLAETSEELAVRHNDQELAFRHLIERHQAAQGQAAERSRLEQCRNELLAKQHTRDELVAQVGALEAKRREMLRSLSVLWEERFAIRRSVAQKITAALGGTVRVSITQCGCAQAYQAMLTEILRNARVKAGLVALKLAQAFWPAQLVSLVRTGDAQALMTEAHLNEEQARRAIDALTNSLALFDLESVELADLPKIELNDNGEYKESTALSTGQKCTAILPILLLDSDRPLLIDQPEDNLDNRFIFECIVGNIRRAKMRRQLIFVTHNPNIPVLGDAQRVLVLDSNGSSARLARAGTVDECRDEIVTLLEGGEEAFRQRLTRYAYT